MSQDAGRKARVRSKTSGTWGGRKAQAPTGAPGAQSDAKSERKRAKPGQRKSEQAAPSDKSQRDAKPGKRDGKPGKPGKPGKRDAKPGKPGKRGDTPREVKSRDGRPNRPASSGATPGKARRSRGKGGFAGVDEEVLEELAKQVAPPPLERRPLSHVGGAVELWGAEGLGPALQAALQVSSDESVVRAHVHGFHSYPARLHPVTARELVRRLTSPKGRVLDPFCGSGTVAVESRLAGRSMGGSDANPFAIELARLKTAGKLPGLGLLAAQVAEQAEERREAKAGPTMRYGQVDRELFDVHVLLELDGLKSSILKLPRSPEREALMLVLTSLLTKVSKSPGDTRKQTMHRRLASGFTIRSFVAKAEELERRLAEFEALLPKQAPRAHLEVCDARALDYVRPSSVNLVLTSPPYPGVYDYVKHHETRMRWLGLDVEGFSRSEIGAQRRLAGQDFARAAGRWDKELLPCLKAMKRALAPKGHIILVIADTVLGGRAWLADRALKDLAPRAGLELIAVASQARPLFLASARAAFQGKPRREHLLVLAHQS
ncbi:MAG: DNA methyltransferase [Polyangiaceae bacterium]